MKISFLRWQVLIFVFSLAIIDLNGQTFAEQGITLPGIANGSAIWGDADNDGDIDILITGLDAGYAVIVKVYRNDGSNGFSDNGTFSPAIPSTYGVYNITGVWLDFDRDGFLDILINIPKSSTGGNSLLIYRHEADHSYLLRTTIDYYTWQGNSLDCGDYDNDGDQDILLVTNNASKIYQNQGNFIFSEQNTIQLDGLTESACEFADYDNDGDLDILMMGFREISYSGISRVYKNNGNNSFTLQTGIYIDGTFDGSYDWGDYNDDGYLDILVTGKWGDSRIYKNNGDNTFFQQDVGTLIGVTEGTGKWGDLDNDGDLDIILSGKTSNTNYTKIYTNNGDNIFEELTGISLDGVYRSSIDLFDYNNDNKLDILLSGDNGTSKICKVYLNGSTVANPLPDAPTSLSSAPGGNDVILQWNPVTTDNTLPGSLSYNIVIRTLSGTENVVSPHSRVSDGQHRISGIGNGQLGTSYTIRNLTQGVNYYWCVQAIDNSFKGGAFSAESNFTYSVAIQAHSLSVPVVDGSTSTLNWSRGNGTNCVVFVKEGNTGTALPENGSTYTASTIFKNGTQIGTTEWYCVYNGPLSTVSITGLTANTDFIFQVCEYSATTYNSASSAENPLAFKTGIFTEVKTANLVSANQNGYISPSTSHWIDIDNDNDLDLFLHGSSGGKLYRNDGSGIFFVLPATFEGGVSSACGDYNNDGFIDIAITANPTKIYKNNGDYTFTEQASSTLPGNSYYGSLDWGDFDNDGDLDLVKTGQKDGEGKTSKVFRNNGNNTFSEIESVTLAGLAYGSSEWADYDNDSYLDLFLSGYNNEAAVVAKLYRNDHNGNLIEQTGIQFTGIAQGSAEWGDYDNDGDPDILLTGAEVFIPVTKIYKNNGNNSFSELTGTTMPSLMNCSAKWGDFDNDGDLDILLSGYQGFYNSAITRVYINNGNDSFTRDITSILPGIGSGSASWGDYDKDGRLDIVLSGQTSDNVIARIYRNNLSAANTNPAVPAELTSNVVKSEVTLNWKTVRSDITPYWAMTYNLRVKTKTSTVFDITSPHSEASGYRRIVAYGNMEHDTTFIFKKMPFGDFTWSVQAVDNGFAGGEFAPDENFTVSPVQAGSLSATILDKNSLLLKWERGNGDRCAVFCKQTSTGGATPVNNTGYIADPEYGFGGQIGTSGWYCVYNGRADSVVVTGLVNTKQYSFHIIEYTGTFGSEEYFIVIADGNPGVFSTSLFTEQTAIAINPGYLNNVSWGDYDNDGFIDMLVPGFPTRIYRNKGDNTFEEKTGITLPNIYWGSAEWGDYDNDKDLDILITGSSAASWPSTSPMTKIYRNNGSEVFSEQSLIILPQLLHSSASWGDYDNDGDLDILINGATGAEPNYNPVTKIYENNGDNTFTEKTQIALTGLFAGSTKWVDYDNDSDLDIVITGSSSNNNMYSAGTIQFYINNGNKTFTEQLFPAIWGSVLSTTIWSDFDKDGDSDFIVTGLGQMRLYRNMGDDGFVLHMSFSPPFNAECTAAWGDYDNDGYQDIIFSNPTLDTKIYRNTHGITVPGAVTQWFNRQDDDAVKSIGYNYISWIDYDNDGDLDFLMSSDNILPTKIFKNNLVMRSGLFKPNIYPAAPSGLDAINSPSGVFLSWDPVQNDETPSVTMSYNVRIGTTKTSFNICPPHSSTSGYRQIASIGNANLDTSFLMLNMPAIKYYWSVQAVDQGLMGSEWSAIDSVEVKNVLAFFAADTVCQGLSTKFTNQSVAFGEAIQSYKWIFETGATSTEVNPSYTFSSAGVKNVTLITFSATTSDTLTKQVLVKVKPLVDFSASVACQGSETILTNLSNITGLTITSWSWDYGDGKGSTAPNPGTHGYLLPGDYDVILSASASNNCSDSKTKTVTVASYPVASIAASTPLAFCSGDSVALSVASYTNHAYKWMSNGTDVTGGTTNRYVARITGNYTVEVINLTGNCKTTSSAAAVTVVNAPAAPLITVSGPLTFCQNDSLLLSVPYTSGYSYQWKLNGGAVGSDSSRFAAKNSGTYTMFVANSNGCSVASTNSVVITVNPVPVVGSISQVGNDLKFCKGENITLSIPANVNYTYSWRKGATVLEIYTNTMVAAQSGDYYVEVSTSSGCKVTADTVTVEVVEPPSVPSIDYGAYTPGMCLGENPIRLSIENVVSGYSYRWYRNGTQIGNSTFIETRDEGKYYLEANFDICTSKRDSVEINLMQTLPEPVIISKGPTVWYLSTASQANYYKWYYNGSLIPQANRNVYVAGQNLGIYRVSISNDMQCFSFSDTVRIPTGATGIEDIDPFEEVKIYPNPTTGLFTIEMNNNLSGELVVDLFTQNGSKVVNLKFDKTTEHFSAQIDLSGQSKGMYLINLTIDKYIATRKILVE